MSTIAFLLPTLIYFVFLLGVLILSFLQLSTNPKPAKWLMMGSLLLLLSAITSSIAPLYFAQVYGMQEFVTFRMMSNFVFSFLRLIGMSMIVTAVFVDRRDPATAQSGETNASFAPTNDLNPYTTPRV